MKLVDLNVLLYAVNEHAPNHERCFEWWEAALNGPDQVGLAWVVILGFLRISTRSGIFPRQLSPSEAMDTLDGWIQHPNAVLVQAGPRHWGLMCGLLDKCGTAGNLTTDAHLAALALEYGATLCSCDHDFARFGPALRLIDPSME